MTYFYACGKLLLQCSVLYITLMASGHRQPQLPKFYFPKEKKYSANLDLGSQFRNMTVF